MTKTTDTDPASPNALAARQLANLKSKLNKRVEAAQKKLNKFKEDLDVNPVYAMEWSLSTFTAAAEHKVFGLLAHAIDARAEKGEAYPEIIKGITESCQREVNMRARDSSASTSPTANVMNREILGCWADALELIDWER